MSSSLGSEGSRKLNSPEAERPAQMAPWRSRSPLGRLRAVSMPPATTRRPVRLISRTMPPDTLPRNAWFACAARRLAFDASD